MWKNLQDMLICGGKNMQIFVYQATICGGFCLFVFKERD